MRTPAVPEPGDGTITVAELQDAEDFWISQAQKETFAQDYSELVQSRDVKAGGLVQLKPYLNEQISLMKVGERLSSAHHLPHSVRSPVILPSNIELLSSSSKTRTTAVAILLV